jgi:hypothetical protein
MAELTAERLREVLHYDAVTGLLVWIKVLSRRVSAGSVAGSVSKNGYRSIMIDKKNYAAHRLAWLYVNGAWPKYTIDHIDGNPRNNKLSNLRDVTNTVNNQNKRKPTSRNSSGFLGVSYREPHKQYRATIRYSGKTVHLGGASTAEAAYQMYLKAKRIFHEGNTL